MKRLTVYLIALFLLTAIGCDKDDPASPKETRPNFENSEGYVIAFYTSTVPTVPERFSRYDEPTSVPTTISVLLPSAHDTVEVEGTVGFAGDGVVMLDDEYELTPDGRYEYFDFVMTPVFQAEINQMFAPGTVHTLDIDSPTWGEYSFDLTVPDQIVLHPYDVSGLSAGDPLEISWDWATDSDFYSILEGDSLTVVEYDAGLDSQPDPSYTLTYQPGATVVIGIHYRLMEYYEPDASNSILRALYQELTFEW